MNYRNPLFDIKISAIGGKKFVNFDRVPRRSLIFKSEEYPIILVNRVLPFEELTCKTKSTFSSSLISFFFFFSRNTKPIEYYSVAAIRAVFNLIRRIRRVHVGGDERINMPGINQSGDRSPYFSWRNSVFEFLSRPGRIQANTKYSPGKKGHLHSAYIRGRSIRRMPPSPPQSRTETRVLRKVYVN